MSMTKHSPEPEYVFMFLAHCDACNRLNNECVCGKEKPEPVKSLPYPAYVGYDTIHFQELSDESAQRR